MKGEILVYVWRGIKKVLVGLHITMDSIVCRRARGRGKRELYGVFLSVVNGCVCVGGGVTFKYSSIENILDSPASHPHKQISSG
jgi:hypothetical protein